MRHGGAGLRRTHREETTTLHELRVLACRLCGAAVDEQDAVRLAVPRGVHYFLHAEELASDAPVTLHIVTCRFCGHLQSLDEPVIYDNHASSATYVSEPLRAARYEQALRTFGYAVRPPASVLEIGCGDGDFLCSIASRVRTAVGIEPSAENAGRARARGIIVDETLLDERTRLTSGPFDVFFAFHVLEHVADVKAFLRGIRANLTPDAVGCIEVPSSEAAYEHRRYGHFMTDHLSYFFAGTLRRAVEDSGFEVIALGREWDGEHLVAYVRARTTQAHCVVPQWVDATTTALVEFLADAARDGCSVALWGASNPILPVLMHLPANLDFVLVDKAPTKHGLYAPGSHVPIAHPDEIARRRIDYVVITAPRFCAEIIAELRERFDAAMEIIAVDTGVAQSVCRLRWPAAAGRPVVRADRPRTTKT